MTPLDPLVQHQKICDELYDLAREENQFLQNQKRAPDAVLLGKKQALLGRLDASLAALRAMPRPDASHRSALEKARSRILQVLQIDRENEQLLLRYSLARSPAAPPAPPPVPASALDKIYARHP